MRQLVVRLLTALSLTAASAWAYYPTSDLYVGLDIFGSNNDFNVDVSGSTYGSYSVGVDSAGFKLKFGALLNDGLRLQGYLLSEKFDEALFDNSNDRLGEIGLDLIKEFEVSPTLSPFIQGGIGYGWMDLDPYYYSSDSINEVNLKLGLGLIFKVTPVFELLAGLDFQWRRWSDIEFYDAYGYNKYQTDDSSQRYYVGANLLF